MGFVFLLPSIWICWVFMQTLKYGLFYSRSAIKLHRVGRNINTSKLWSTSELRVRLAPWNRFKRSSKIFLLTVTKRFFFVDHLCCFCLVFVMFLCLFIAALWSPAGKGLTSWLSFVIFVFCHFVVSWIRCGTWLYWFLIFAPFYYFEILSFTINLHFNHLHTSMNFSTSKSKSYVFFFRQCFSVNWCGQLIPCLQ